MGCRDQEDGKQVLLKYKASVDMRKQNNGLSALHFACQDGHVETARVLVACGANVNAAASIPGEAGRVRGDQTAPLHSAVISGHVEVRRLFDFARVLVHAVSCHKPTA
eukprot:3133872-Rhodomonas_salina.1